MPTASAVSVMRWPLSSQRNHYCRRRSPPFSPLSRQAQMYNKTHRKQVAHVFPPASRAAETRAKHAALQLCGVTLTRNFGVRAFIAAV
jgi:hypothetical protein